MHRRYLQPLLPDRHPIKHQARLATEKNGFSGCLAAAASLLANSAA